MKKMLIWAMVACLLLLCACSPTTAIAGTYTDSDGLVYTFAGDGSFSVSNKDAVTGGTYTLTKPDGITLKYALNTSNSKTVEGTYKLEDNVLTLTGTDGTVDVLTKVAAQ